jgi:DNA/RNA endonuclease YhcR with UshA esterase domain
MITHAPIASENTLESSHPSPSPSASHCGSCGRFIGPYDRCPYCGAGTQGRLSMRAVKGTALLLATLGLLALWLLARQSEVPTLQAGDASGTMNLAYVRLNGRVVRNLNYDPTNGYLGFWVADETGEVYVSMYRDVTANLLAEDRVPAIGDEVSVAGTLRVREGMVSMTVNVPEHLTLDRGTALQLNAADITMLDEGLRVQVAGEVVQITEPYPGLTLIKVADKSGEITIAVDEVVTALTGELPEIAVGQTISVEGAVGLYRTTPQVLPGSVTDVVPVPALPEAGPLHLNTLNELSVEDERKQVRARGQVVLLEGLPGGVKATLDDGTAQVMLLLWDRIHQALPEPAALDIGAEVEVIGEVKLYREQLEIIPARAQDVNVLVRAEPAPWVQIADLSTADAGRIVRLRGLLGEPYGFSAGVKAQLNDGSGRITLLFWSNLYTQFSPQPQAGQEVEVTGIVAAYRGNVELIPRSRYDWYVRLRDD